MHALRVGIRKRRGAVVCGGRKLVRRHLGPRVKRSRYAARALMVRALVGTS